VKRVTRPLLRFYKPTFYVLAERYFLDMGVDRENVDKVCLPVTTDFLVVLRAILDARHNLYLLNHRKPDPCPLSAFAASWLTHFTLDTKTKKILQLSSDFGS
jgi:hypothetical protein